MKIEELQLLDRTVTEESEWRHRPENVYKRDGLSLVSRVKSEGKQLKAAVRESVDLIGGFRRALSPGDRVLLKPNFNSDDPFPASTDVPFLMAVVELLREEGITDLTVGERSGWPWLPTANVLEKTGLLSAAREIGLPVLNFDEGPWMDVRLGNQAKWWKSVAFHGSLKRFDKIVYLPCMKHHRFATFTMSLKLAVGMTHPRDMLQLHADSRLGRPEEPMYQKMLEFDLAVTPDLIIMDGRKAFVTNGPATGELVEPGLLFASGDPIALDVEGLKALQSYPRDNLIQGPIWEMPLIKRAVELGLGARSADDYIVVR